MFPRKLDKNILKCFKCICIADDILIVGYDIDGKDHDDTLKSTTNMQVVKLKTKQRQMPFQMHISPIFTVK